MAMWFQPLLGLVEDVGLVPAIVSTDFEVNIRRGTADERVFFG
jgi:hypothetical protein